MVEWRQDGLFLLVIFGLLVPIWKNERRRLALEAPRAGCHGSKCTPIRSRLELILVSTPGSVSHSFTGHGPRLAPKFSFYFWYASTSFLFIISILLLFCTCLRRGCRVSSPWVERPIFERTALLPVFAVDSHIFFGVHFSYWIDLLLFPHCTIPANFTSPLQTCLQAGCGISTGQLWRVLCWC